jgi:fructoselysine-6-P-deglycase FrlB-like protein
METMVQRSPMLEDVGRQPAVLRALATRADDFRAAGASLGRAEGRVVVTSCGDGHFAGEAASSFAARLGLDWHVVGPLDLLVRADELRSSDRVIAISMSGNVDRTVEAARLAQARGLPILAIVNGEGGKLGAIARTKISLDLPDIAPFLCGTASYTATLAALTLVVEGLAGEARLDLAAVAAVQAQALATSGALAEIVARQPVSGVRVLAAGAERGTAAYGAAKLVELTRIPAWNGELEEFAHSQYWAMPETDLVVILSTHPRLTEYARESARALSVLGVPTLAIETAETPVETARWRITLPPFDAVLAPLVSALPMQRLAYEMAKATGFDPDTRAHLKGDETRFRVSRMLTRRSLLGTGL